MKFYKRALASLLLLGGCAGSGLLAGEPMGRQLERALEEIKKDCIGRGAPPFGPGSTQYSDTSCLMFTLKPWEPGDTPESAFAHSIKLPPPHDKPKEVYKPGMSSEEYFNALCKEEAGEWVFRRVQNVKGIRQERPTQKSRGGEYRIAFFAREPQAVPIDVPGDIFDEKSRTHWEYFERQLASNDSRRKIGKYEYFDATARQGRLLTTPQSNFAYLSRGIRRPFDREHAIEGIEFVVYQVEPFEVLGLQRTISRFYIDRTTDDRRTPWAAGCPSGYRGPYEFLRNVLNPSID